MKKLHVLLLMLPALAFTQIHIDNQWKNNINPIFQNLDKSRVQSGILLDYAMEFTDVEAYNGVLTDTTYINANILGDIYKTLFMAKVSADTIHTPLFDRYAYNWARERFNATKDSTGVYILTGLLYEYQKLDGDAYRHILMPFGPSIFDPNPQDQNRITVSNSKYYDKFVNGVWQNPYLTQKTFALTPPILHSRSKDIYFKLPNELFLSNLGNQITNIQIDAGNGQGYKNLPFNTAIQIQFFENKIHDLTFKVTLNNNQTLYCRSKFKIDDPVLDQQQQQARGAIVVNDERVYIHEDSNFFSAAWLTIRRRQDSVSPFITRPLIIAEGLDTGNFTAPDDFGGETTLQNFIADINTEDEAGELSPLLLGNSQQYDLIYIDWVRGMADMRDNSKVLEEVIEWVNAQKVGNEPNVLLGQSMGGVIGRYTLARMENAQTNDPNAPDHDVRLFIAHDSPMQGANTPLAFQHFSAHMKEEYVSSPLIWATGEVLVPIGYGLAQIGSDLLNVFGANTSVPSFVTPSQLLSIQDQTAARQLNYWSAYSTLFGQHAQTRSENLAWQQTLSAEGWPTQSRNIAISNGNECGADNGFEPGAQLIDIDSRSNPGFLLDMMNAFLAPRIGVVTFDLGLVLTGAIPGRSRWQTNFDFNSYGTQGSENRIYRGRIRFEKKILWIGPTVYHDITNRSYYAPQDALPFDTFSGGRLNFFDEDGDFVFDDIPILPDLMDVINDFYGFVPVVSALDITKTNGNDPTPDDYLKSYSGGIPADTNLESGFDAFFVDNQPDQTFNNEHISFEERNGNWLAAELEANQPGNTFPVQDNCSFVCDSASFGSGLVSTCASQFTVTAPAGGDTYQWAISGASGYIEDNPPSPNVVIVKRNPGISGFVTIYVNITSAACGNAFFERQYYLGSKTVNSVNKINLNTIPHFSSGGQYCDIGLELNYSPSNSGILEIQWQKLTSSVQWILNVQDPTSRNVVIYPSNNQVFNFRVRTRTACGWSQWQNLSYNITSCGSARVGNPTTAFKVYPNPAEDIVNITLEDTDSKLSNYKNVTAELFDIVGRPKQNIQMNRNEGQFSVARLTPGVYLLKIYMDSSVEHHQIIVK
ncbi:MAG: T9SS type A sorting domain-containing protein [Psychroserpens sp.]|uniref:T9SS type A sorting domain-containing protein n=1 Tax=Psychroserpens sp. TaxID=2020870 RepID=UPI003C829DA9